MTGDRPEGGGWVISEVVPDVLAGERLDKVVALRTGLSRADVAALVEGGAVRVGGRPVVVRSRRLVAGEVLEVTVPGGETDAVSPEPGVAIDVVHDDRDVIVVDKPPGLVVHPGAGHERWTLVAGLLARYPELAGVGEPGRPGIVHRLDKGTSGLLVVARSPAAYRSLVAQLAGHEVERRYLALVWGALASDAGLVDAPLGRGERDPTRMAVSATGREARTRYQVEHRYDRPGPASLLVCRLETGRTHQIRAHLAAIGHPVVGDDRYGGERQRIVPTARPFLHATALAFDHPVSGVRLSFESPLPADLAGLLTRFTLGSSAR